uniref:GPI ethanolamine phosphate transferase 3 isoform X2 n=1 Tax=Doryrhamphus excisus TaxID=161450 RepID=UPI0025AE474A|nr:GPI ethanolamine phosphate transferase 3 isoform X2 [Doryrhamphus excisus]
MNGLPLLSLLLWVCAVYFVGLYLFVSGFLLVRLEVNRTSTCGDVLEPQRESRDFCGVQPRFRRVVLLIVDALKIDFARFDHNNTQPRPFENKLPVFEETASSRPSQCRLYPFRADPPTTTMQRIKGFTTGSLPTFVDIGNNFASSAILEDNLIHQLGQVGKRVVFMGDDTWDSLFPQKFHRSLPFPSFNVKDLHTVDNGILQHLYTTMVGDDWDVLIAHFLGVDHCGHRFGPDHPAMAEKLTQMDGVIRSVIDRLQNDTLLVVMGDHGMTDTGDHGGESQKETDAAIFLYSPFPIFPGPPSKREPDVVPQTDLVPTLALLLGVPIPYSSVGQVLLPLFPLHGHVQDAVGGLNQLEALWINTKQVNRFLETYSIMAKDIAPESLTRLKDQFASLSSKYLTLVREGHASSSELAVALQAYLTSVRDTCRATWARFNPLKMPVGLLPSPASSTSTVRKETITLFASLALLVGSLYLSLFFHGCREEQGACQPSPFLSSLSRVQDNQLKNIYYVLSVLSLVVWTHLLRRCLRHYGNLNSSGGTVFTAHWILPLLSVCLGLHWAVSASSEDSFRNLAELIRLAQLALPRAAFCLLGLGLALIWLDPLTVFVKTRAASLAKSLPLPPPRYRASTGISPQAELHHLIPQIYQRMRRSLDDGEASGSGEEDNRPAVEAYGLGTVYSAPLILFCGLLGLGLLQLHPEGMALSFLLLLLEMGALLNIHASSTTLCGLQGVYSGGFNVAWTPIVLWSLAANQFFHATGHLPTFSSIQWGAAFVGFPDGHTGTILPASLVTLNTFASHILFAVGCPLLLFWPLVCEVRGNRGGKASQDGGEDAVMEMRLRESPQLFTSALLQLSVRYILIQGAQVFASVCGAAILRRHLMVWKVFAPKLMFEASGFLMSCMFLLLGVLLVLRVDLAVGRWFKRLISDTSR